MGRPRKDAPPREPTKRSYDSEWFKERNERRRQKYAESAAYREQQKAMVRNTYHKTKEMPAYNEWKEANPLFRVLGRLDKSGSRRKIATQIDGAETFILLRMYTIADVGIILDKNPQVISRWCLKDLLPEPIFMLQQVNEAGVKTTSRAYFYDEVKIIVTALCDHFQEFPYYRSNDVGVRDKIFDLVYAARLKRGFIHAPKPRPFGSPAE